MNVRLVLLVLLGSGAPTPSTDAGAGSPGNSSPLSTRRKRLADAENYLTVLHEKDLCRVSGSGKPARDLVQLCAEMRVELPLIKEGLRKAHAELDTMQKQAEADGGVAQSRVEREAQERLVDGLIERSAARIDLLYKSVPGGD